MDDHSRHLAASIALVTATPVAVWGLVGDLSEKGFTDLDYAVSAPHVHPVVAVLAGLASVTVAIVAAVTLWEARRHGSVSRGWLATPVLLCAAGALLAFGWRIVTAGVIGANIGGGLFILLGLPTAVALVIAAGANAWWESRRR